MGVEASKELPEHVLEVPSLHEVPLSRGTQDLPDFARPGSAAGAPIMKERALLQARYRPFLRCCLWQTLLTLLRVMVISLTHLLQTLVRGVGL